VAVTNDGMKSLDEQFRLVLRRCDARVRNKRRRVINGQYWLMQVRPENGHEMVDCIGLYM